MRRSISRRRWPLFFYPAIVVVLVAVAACGDDGTGPDSTPSLRIGGGPVALYALSDTVTLTAEGAEGSLTWASHDETIATVTARTPDGVEAEASVTVDAVRWIDAAAGESFVCGLAPDGSAFCWGHNDDGQLGNGSDQTRVAEPRPVTGGHRFRSISAGEDHVCAVDVDDAAYCWGQYRYGELGAGGAIDPSRRPLPVAGGRAFESVSAGPLASCGVTRAGAALCWGDNRAGQLGDGTRTERRAPVPVAGQQLFRGVDAGTLLTCGLHRDGSAHCWGLGITGALGNGRTEVSEVPVRVEAESTYQSLAAGTLYACAVTDEGSVHCWGEGEKGQLGTIPEPCNPEIPLPCSTVPVPVALPSPASTVVASGFSDAYACALTEAGAYCWGAGRTEPHRVTSDGRDFTALAAGTDRICGLLGDGTMRCWRPDELSGTGGPDPIPVPPRLRRGALQP